ncbi:MAG: RimK family protein [Acidobacteria bacterium]|nr:RimK family protein [Acidobacteriota bacterium]
MKLLLVVSNVKNWPLNIPNVEVISAKKYITEPVFSRMTGARVFNVSRLYRYQGLGYYVSLLAEARGHRPVPSITTIRDLYTPAMVRLANVELSSLIQKRLRSIRTDHFTLSIYFGKNIAHRYDDLCRELCDRFHCLFLRAEFERGRDGSWDLQDINPIGMADVPKSHYGFILKTAKSYFTETGYRRHARQSFRYSTAILHKPDAENSPSNPRALDKFIKAGRKIGVEVDLITRENFNRLGEYDALFIRETTSVNDHTFRFARYAEADGLVVIDDPQSIIKCANKVYLAEMLAHQRVKTPHTMIVHRDNVDLIVHEIGLPCILKQPDGSFSTGVKKATNARELAQHAMAMLERSELIIAQKFLPTAFDWRVGILDRQALFVCRYYMAPNHWQIIHNERQGAGREGRVETLSVEQAPALLIKTALRATNPIGDGLYGVDIKQAGSRFYVMEVNDNPNIDAGIEDGILKNALYDRIMGVFLNRIESRKKGSPGNGSSK